jgi:hypothetical protein
LREKGIAHYLNWIENYSLRIRESIRQGEEIRRVEIYCELAKLEK